MDISALLSPQETPKQSPRSTPTNQHQRQLPPAATTSATLSTRNSPFARTQALPPISHVNSMSPPSRPITSTQRTTSGIDTLADLASMQQHSQRGSRSTPAIIRTHERGIEKQPTAQAVRPSLESIARAHSGSRSSLDIHMMEAPTQVPESRAFKSSSLSEDDLNLVQQLTSYLAEHPNAYSSHLQLIKTLRNGFLSHVYSTEESPEEHDPTTYDLLPELRQAREAMASRFTIGEKAWVERIQDEMLLARNLEDCVQIVELCEKAVVDEVASTKLWALYGDFVLGLYSAAQPGDESVAELHDGLDSRTSLSENDLLVAAEVYSKAEVTEVWRRAAEDVKYNISDSHLVWNKYTDLLMLQLGKQLASGDLKMLHQHYSSRLYTPHANWDDTFQRFSSFISTYQPETYEKTMVEANKKSAPGKALYSAREEYELQLRKANEAGDSDNIWAVLSEYLDWEIAQPRKKQRGVAPYSYDLANALYQRATLVFPTVTDLWEDHLVLLAEESDHREERISPLALLGRACEHCPWSGKLWSLYIQAAERQSLSFADIGQIKHKATSTGLLDSTSMEDILTIHTAWCSCLRRRAFSQWATDEEADVAEVGIRSAIEDMESLGKQKEGKAYKGDPQYRLERIYIKFLAQKRKFDLARNVWKKLVHRQGDYYEFWLRYYTWEIHCWSYELGRSGSSSMVLGPVEATKVLLQAAQRVGDTDWPEKILDTYLEHCQDHEDVANIDTALRVWRRAMKDVKKRREREAQEYAEQQQSQLQAQALVSVEETSATNGHATKRKRDDSNEVGNGEAKKIKSDDTQGIAPNESLPAQSQVKRDRENSTVIVKNLPLETAEDRLQHFFRDCGVIKSILITKEEDNDSASAAIEFGSNEDALAALTKDQKSFNDRTIEVGLGTGTTLYVTNFPPQADETWIRSLFGQYGEITDVRFPSLKYNTHRRFCYVQFKSSADTQAATALDETIVEGNLKLVAKFSDPAHKDKRHGAVHEGREVFVKNVNWSFTEDDLARIFEKYGKVEKVRIPKKHDGKSKGFAYVVFDIKQDAESSLVLNETELGGRKLAVSIAEANPGKRSSKTIVDTNQIRTSASPAPNGSAATSGSAGSPPPQSTAQERSARTIALFHIPDTVNAARIQTLLESHGTIEEINLKPTHQGAIVVFATAAEAGKAALSIAGHEIIPGRAITTGSVSELFKTKAETKDSNPGVKKSGKATGITGALLQPTGPIRRPTAAGSSRRGGLGARKGLGFAKGIGTGGTNEDANTGKNNDEFRRMFVAGKKDDKE